MSRQSKVVKSKFILKDLAFQLFISSSGQFGFLSYEQEEGKKLFFHMSEVEGGEVLQVGDEVEFVVVTNQRTRKHSACCVRKLW